MLPIRSHDQEALDYLHILAKGLLQTNDQVEFTLALNHLSSHLAAHRRLNQRVDVADVEPVVGDLPAVRRNEQAGLTELPDNRDIRDPPDTGEQPLDLVRLGLQGLEVRAEDLDRQATLQSRFGLVHRIFGGLRVVEDDAGERREPLIDRADELPFSADTSLPGGIVVGLQSDIELVVEEPGWVGAIIRAPQLVCHRGDLRKTH